MTNQKENNLTHNKRIPTKRKANLQGIHIGKKTKQNKQTKKSHTPPNI